MARVGIASLLHYSILRLSVDVKMALMYNEHLSAKEQPVYVWSLHFCTFLSLHRHHSLCAEYTHSCRQAAHDLSMNAPDICN